MRAYLLLFAQACLLAASQPVYWPRGEEWQTETPAKAGIDATALEDALRFAAEHNSSGVLVVRHGRIVAERYWQKWNRDSTGPIYSASKSVAATLVGMAIEEGKLRGVSQPMAAFFPSLKSTIRHHLTMTSGLKVTMPDTGKGDEFEATAALPLEHPPGTAWAYNTSAYRLLLRVLELATGENLNDYTRRKLTGPLGMSHTQWDGPPVDDHHNWMWIQSSVRDMAKFGLLALHRGQWDGRQLVSEKFMKEATSKSQDLNEAYGYLWWLNGSKSYMRPGRGGVHQGMLMPDCPPDAFAALGAADKKIYIVPSLDLVVTRQGGAAKTADFDNQLLGRFCKAMHTR